MRNDLQSDNDLFYLMASGSETAFTALYNRYWDKLLFVAARKLDDLSLAEELVQDIFADLWNRRAAIVLNSSIAAYLATAMKYKVIDARLKKRRHQDYHAYAGQHLQESDHSTEQWLRFTELRDRLESLVAALPERCQLTYRLSRVQGLSQREIATELKISEKAVERNLTRAIKSLKIGLRDIISLFF